MDRSFPFLHTSGPNAAETDPAVIRRTRQEEAVLGYRLFGSFGWGDDGAGHISARDPERTDHFWLLGYGIPFRSATVEDLVLIGPDGSVVEGDRDYNPAAFTIHGPIHEARPDVACVAHTHTPYGTPFAALAKPIRMMSQEACAFYDDQGLFEGEEVDVLDYAVGRRLAAALGGGRLLVLANHGLLSVGPTVAEAIGSFIMAERACEVQVKVPQGRVISDQAAANAYKSVGSRENAWHVFEWCVRSRLMKR
jgi:ribulose-5-phosphate 4-epimerase/fuculose-1-phosphate aldolase